MLALDHKGLPYETVVLATGLHPFLIRLLGFPGNASPIRSVDGHTGPALALMDRMGTVPALRHADQRAQTNLAIIDFLEELRPEPPLFPTDAAHRAAVEEALRWGDGPLQMAARRTVMAAAGTSLAALHERGARGRLGPLLAGNGPGRVLLNGFAARTTFAAGTGHSEALVGELGGLLDRVDGWIADGTLNGGQLNAADLMIAPSLALLDYRLDLREQLRARPAYALLERLLPEPVAVGR